jgi:hypothetical protein
VFHNPIEDAVGVGAFEIECRILCTQAVDKIMNALILSATAAYKEPPSLFISSFRRKKLIPSPPIVIFFIAKSALR